MDLQRKVTEATTIASAPGILTRCSSAPKPFLAFYPVLPRAAPTKLSTTNFHFIVTHYTVELSAPIMDKLHAICNQLPAVPQCGLVLLATVGGLFVASKLFSYLRLVLGSFILPGTNVCRCAAPPTQFSPTLTCNVAASKVWQGRHLGRRDWRF